MHVILVRLAFIRSVHVTVVLLLPLLLITSTPYGQTAFVTSKILESLPMVVMGLVGGVLIDRYGASRINTMALALFMLPPVALAAVYFQAASADVLLGLATLLGIITQLLVLCGDRLILEVVAKSDIPRYNARALLIERGCSLALPPLVGALAAWSQAVAIAACAGLALAGALTLIRSARALKAAAPTTPASSVLQHVATGFAQLVETKFLWQLAILVMFINAVEAIPLSYSFVYAHEGLGMTIAEIGLVTSMGGLGGIIGATLITRIPNERSALLTVLVGSIIFNALLYGAIFIINSKLTLLIGKMLESASFVFSAVAWRSMRQDTIDKANFGVISGALGVLVKFAVPFAVALGGLLMLKTDARTLYGACAVIEMLLGVVAVRWAWRYANRTRELRV